MEKRIAIPRIVVRPILPPPLEIGVRIRPQWLHWQVGRYREKLSFGPGGEGKAKIWVPEREGEQHNLILNQFYDSLIRQHGFVGPSKYAAVGTGSNAPNPFQTQLANEIGTSTNPKRTNFVPTGESNEIEALATPGEYNIRRVLEFTEAQVGGLNLTEWGFSPVGSRNGPLMTRELFRDGSGLPIVLTLATDQRLRLIYRYKVTVSPTSPQNVSVNIGGDGPGIRTAKFTLTGRFASLVTSTIYEDIPLINDEPYNRRRGDLLLLDAFVKADTSRGLGTVGILTEAVPLTYEYDPTTGYYDSFAKRLSYEAHVGRSRRASVLLQASDYPITIKSVFVSGFLDSFVDLLPTCNLVFDDGQEFTKDNLHKLLIAYWQVTWGP